MSTPKKLCECEEEKKNPSLEEIDNSKEFVTRYEALHTSGDFSDLVLQVGETRYQAHKFILVTASEVFRVMLCSDPWAEVGKSEITLTEEEECVDVFGCFLRYLYCGCVTLTTNTVLPILLLADKYGVQALRQSCIDYMLRHIVESPDSNRTLTWYQYAKMTSQTVLAEDCRKFILSNFDIILKTADWLELTLLEMSEFLKSSEIVILSELLLWTDLQRWLLSEKNRPDLETNLKEVIPLLRFTKIYPQNLAEIEASDICAEHEELFVEKLHKAYRHHSLAVEAAMIPNLEPFRNYTHSTYGLSHPFSLAAFSRVQLAESRIHLPVVIPTQYFSASHVRRPDQSVHFDIYVFPKGSIPTFLLYGNYNRSTHVKVRILRRRPDQPPMLVEVTLILYGMKNATRYVAFTHHASIVFTRELSELQLDNLLEVARLEEKNSAYLVDGNLEGRIFLRLQDAGEHL